MILAHSRYTQVFAVSCEIFLCSTWTLELWSMGSVLAVPWLSCSTPCGILVPKPGIQSAPPALQGGALATGPQGKSRVQHFWIWRSCPRWFLFLKKLTVFWLWWVFFAAQGLLFIAVPRPLLVVVSLVVEHSLKVRGLSGCSSRAPVLRLSDCGTQA